MLTLATTNKLQTMSATAFEQFLSHCQNRCNRFLSQAIEQQPALFSQSQTPSPALVRLQQASAYSIENGGKRLRPALFYACCEALNANIKEQDLDRLASAIECIHSYSLVHDDLPAMDDDALRRGKPTCHIAFDEATAILVGDGLQALAFELISNCESLNATTQIRLVQQLAQAAGNKGMVGGQMIDLAATDKSISVAELENMHRLKTGAMIRVCAQMAATCAAASAEQTQALDHFAAHLGLAFQVHDDILDIESDTETLGKTQGADIQQAKQTYPALLGLEASKTLRDDLVAKAISDLQSENLATDKLLGFADFMLKRRY
jgi:geranylgeranyl pyrophosphate synthase